MKFDKIVNLVGKIITEDTVRNLIPLFQKEVVGDKQWKDLTPDEQKKVETHIETRKKELETHVAETTTNPQYQSWIYKNLKNGDLVFPEDISKTKESLKQFEQVKNLKDYKGSKKIDDYASQKDLYASIRTFLDKNKPVSKDIEADAGGNPILHEEGLYQIIELDDYNYALQLIEKTNWCVKHRNNWDEYGPPYYMIAFRNKPFALVHFGTQQIKDVDDNEFQSKNVTDEFFQVVKWLIANKHNNDFKLFNDFLPVLVNRLGAEYAIEAVGRDTDAIFMIDDIENYNLDALLAERFRKEQERYGHSTPVPEWRNGNEEDKRHFVQHDGKLIKFVNNPSERIQRVAVEDKPSAIRYIKNPSEKTQYEAVSCDPRVIEFIPNPSEEIQIQAVRESPFYLKFIKNPLLATKIQAVITNPGYIAEIKNPEKEVQMAAVAQNGRVIAHIENPDADVKRQAVETNPDSIIYIPDADEKLQLEAIRKGAHFVAYIIHPTKEVLKRALTVDPYLITKIKIPAVTAEQLEEFQKMAVRHTPNVITVIKNPSDAVQYEAAKALLVKYPDPNDWSYSFRTTHFDPEIIAKAKAAMDAETPKETEDDEDMYNPKAYEQI